MERKKIITPISIFCFRYNTFETSTVIVYETFDVAFMFSFDGCLETLAEDSMKIIWQSSFHSKHRARSKYSSTCSLMCVEFALSSGKAIALKLIFAPLYWYLQ